MARHCETFEHTADVGLSAWGDDLGELLAALAEGLIDVVCDRSAVRGRQTRPLTVEAQDREALAVDFLSQVLYAFDADGFLTHRARVVAVAGGAAGEPARISAELSGEPYDPGRHEIRTEVKAVTYHQLRIAPDEAGRWVGRVILDL